MYKYFLYLICTLLLSVTNVYSADIYANRVGETTRTTGTGTIVLDGAKTGYRTFVSAIGDGNTCKYLIINAAGQWEIGSGTVTDAATDTLSRDTVESSSSADVAVNFSAGPKTVYCVLSADQFDSFMLESNYDTESEFELNLFAVTTPIELDTWAEFLLLFGITGTPDGTKYLRDDGTWQTPADGTGAVDSVNGETGTVVLDADDISESTTRFYDDDGVDAGSGVSIEAYGATTGSADNVTEIQAALNAEYEVYVPYGTYICSGLTIPDGVTLRGPGKLVFKTGETGIFLLCSGKASIRDIELDGGDNISKKSVDAVWSNRRGILIYQRGEGSILSGLNIHGFGSDGIYVYDTDMVKGSQPMISDVNIYYCYTGIYFANNQSEYVTASGLNLHHNYQGLYLGAGNLHFTGVNIVENYIGVRLVGTGIGNNGHGSITGGCINHSIYAVLAEDITNGYLFTGVTMYVGVILLDNCDGVNIQNGNLQLDDLFFDGGGRNYIRNNLFHSALDNTLVHDYNGNADDTICVGNYYGDGIGNNDIAYLEWVESLHTSTADSIATFGATGLAEMTLKSAFEPADSAIAKTDEAETLSAGWNLGTPASGDLSNCTGVASSITRDNLSATQTLNASQLVNAEYTFTHTSVSVYTFGTGSTALALNQGSAQFEFGTISTSLDCQAGDHFEAYYEGSWHTQSDGYKLSNYTPDANDTIVVKPMSDGWKVWVVVGADFEDGGP